MTGQAPVRFGRYEQATRVLNRAFVAAASVCTIAIVALVLLAVGSRILGSPVLWPYDITQFALVYVVFLALAPALESGHHVVVELFDHAVPRVIRPYVQHIAAALTIVFGMVLLWQLWRTTSRAFADDRLAVASIAVPLKWVYVIGRIGTVQFILTALADLGRAQWPLSEPARAAPAH